MLVYLGLGTPEHRSLPTLETTTRRPSRLNQPTIEDACAPAHVYRKLQTCVVVIGKLLLVTAGRTTGSCRLRQASWRVSGGGCGGAGRATGTRATAAMRAPASGESRRLRTAAASWLGRRGGTSRPVTPGMTRSGT